MSVTSPVFSTNNTDRHDITEILLKVVLSTINQPKPTIGVMIPFHQSDFKFPGERTIY
jgi:hypothetical protein